METTQRSAVGFKILQYICDQVLLFYEQATENHAACLEILRVCLFALVLPFFVDHLFDFFRAYVFPSFFLTLLTLYYWNHRGRIDDTTKSSRTVKFFGDDQNQPTTTVEEKFEEYLIILLLCADVACGTCGTEHDPFLFLVCILFLFRYCRFKSRDDNLNLIIFVRLVSFRAFFESPCYLKILLAYSPILAAYILHARTRNKVKSRASIIRRHLLAYESHHSNSPATSTPTAIIDSLTFTPSDNIIFSSANNDRECSLKKRANSYSNTASSTTDDEKNEEDLLLVGEGARANAGAEEDYLFLTSATGCEYFIDTSKSNASASSGISSSGASNQRKAASSPEVIRRKNPNLFCPSLIQAVDQSSLHKTSNSRPMPRSSHSYGGEMATSQNKSTSSSLLQKNRRTSLPAGPLAPAKISNNLSEARGLISELLLNKDLPNNVVSCLKAVNALLNPNQVPVLTTSWKNLEADIAGISETPFIGAKLLNPDSLINVRRPSVITWSTVTSAAGLPHIEVQPNRSRSIGSRKDAGFCEFKLSSFDKESSVEDEHVIKTCDGTTIEVQKLTTDTKLLECCSQWDFEIFDYHADNPDTVLSRMSYRAFDSVNLFSTFSIDKTKFFNFFHQLERGYRDLPYHNRIHASDVVHSVVYFTQNRIPALPEAANGLSDIFSSLELLALYTAAAMHDYDHPGLTNAFLVSTGDPKALLYNDRSVLENHHAASAWALLIETKNNFVENLDKIEYKMFRFIVLETILATDLKRHFDIVMEFNEKIACKMDWHDETDKLLLAQMLIKMADINSPTKSFALHKQWTDRILEEFYAQGDEERRLGLPVSIYMDRQDATQVAKLQDSFLAHLVKPLTYALHHAGMLPLSQCPAGLESLGSLDVVIEQIMDEDDTDDESPVAGDQSATMSSQCPVSKNSSSKKTIYKYNCDLIINIDSNHEYWKSQMPKELDEDVTTVAARKVSRCTSDSGGHESEMETINEDDDEAGE